ncbi:MAG: aspartate dehydrogenase [Blautia sp.]|nr:aspartate dehydrogenase [Blautia sp.]
MKWLFKKEVRKETLKTAYDPKEKKPVIRSSICTGEKVAGFRDLKTGKFEEIMLIRNDADREEYLKMYGIKPEELTTEY